MKFGDNEIKVVDKDDESLKDCDYVVAARDTPAMRAVIHPDLMATNITTDACELCGHKVIHRPDVPINTFMCIECAFETADEDTEMVTTNKAMTEAKDNIKKMGN